MGDMADYINEQIEVEDEAYADYCMGRMTCVEAYDRGIIDELGYLIGPYSGYNIEGTTCRCCKKTGLRWGQIGGKWILFEGNEIHDCPAVPLETKK